MIRAMFFKHNAALGTELPPERFAKALADPKGCLWVDLAGEPPEVCEPLLRETFHFHPLAVDDALQETHVPKLDDWKDYLYIVMGAITFEPEGDDVEISELDIFLGHNYVVTHHDLPIQALNRVWEAGHRDDRYLTWDADHLLYKLIDEIVTDYMQTVESMDEEIEAVEDRVFDRPTTQILQRLFTLKRATLHLRRILSPTREVLNKLARDDFDVVDGKDQVYFRDIYDHLVRLHDITESLRDLVGGALDTYLSVINNRMNDIMKTLTIITTLFMPLSFVVGFFGQNFFGPVAPSLGGWTSVPVFVITLLLMGLTPLAMLGWMLRRGWTREERSK
jgi:magnesium transporter